MKLILDDPATGRIFDETDDLIAQTYSGMGDPLVRRFNAHDGLVLALREIARTCDGPARGIAIRALMAARET